MKFQRIIETVYFQPWSITRDGWMAVHKILAPYLAGKEPPKIKADDGETDFFGNAIPKMQITPEGVAIIPIIGTLIHHASLMDKLCGACSYDDVKNDLRDALGQANLKKIVLHIASPGGMCMGATETAELITQIREMGYRIEAVTDELIGSAAYYLAAGCDKISCTPSALVGSIGTFAAILDESLAFEMEGLKMEVIKSGEFKGAGIPGTKLSDAQRAEMQSRVDLYAKLFRDHVSKYRPVIDKADMQGQAFIGAEAVARGFADAVIDDVRDGFSL